MKILCQTLAIILGLLSFAKQAAANDYGRVDICGIVAAALTFETYRAGATTPCGEDQITEERLCLLRENGKIILTNREVTLSVPALGNLGDTDALASVTKLERNYVADLLNLRDQTADEASFIASADLRANIERQISSIIGILPTTKNASDGLEVPHDYMLQRLERLYQGDLRRLGPDHPDTLRAKAALEQRREVWAELAAEPRQKVRQRLSANLQTQYNVLKGQSNSLPDLPPLSNKSSSKSWAKGQWDCGSDYHPARQLVVTSAAGDFWSESGKSFEAPRQWHWHPKSFRAVNLWVSDDGRTARLFNHGTTGSHTISLGGPPRQTVLQKQGDEWVVVGASDMTTKSVLYR